MMTRGEVVGGDREPAYIAFPLVTILTEDPKGIHCIEFEATVCADVKRRFQFTRQWCVTTL